MSNELALNTRLCDLLAEAGIDVREEAVQPDGSRIDIQCFIDGHSIAIEAEHGYSNSKRASAIADADAKLKRRVCVVAIALVYPDEMRTRRDLDNGEVQASVRTADFGPSPKATQWRTIKVQEFAEYLRQAPNELGAPHVLAGKADVAIKHAASQLSEEEAASVLSEMGDNARQTTVEGLLTDLLTAIMFHVKLDAIRNQVDPLADMRSEDGGMYEGDWPPMTVRQCIDSDQVAQSFRSAWEKWLAVDYRQILEWSCSTIDAMAVSPSRNTAIQILAEAAIDIQSSAGSQHHDLVGITFCQSLTNAKNDGSMYTTIPAATMLVNLMFDDADVDWHSYESVSSLRIADFACGTGTLLIAAANYVLQHEMTGRRDEVARGLLEQILYGFDINHRAIFQTATGLGMIAPKVAFRKMHLYSLRLGIDEKGNGRLGALELLEGLHQLSLNPPPTIGIRIDSTPAPIETTEFTMAIMNPPYTRNSKRHHHLPKDVKEAVNQREKELYKGTNISHTGNIGGFVMLADKHLATDGGRLALVGPSAWAAGKSGDGIRRDLAARFHIKYIIVSYDPRRIYHSGNTSIGEMLLVAERKRPDEDRPTTVVKLTTNPQTASDAAACAASIVSGLGTNPDWGFVDTIPREVIERGDWSAAQFASNELYEFASTQLWPKTLGKLVEVTTIGRRIHEHTKKCNPRDSRATPALYDHKVEHCDRLLVPPDHYVNPKRGNTRALKYLNRVHRLKLPTRLSLTSVKNVACLTSVPTVGAAWQSGVPVINGKHSPEDAEKAITLILNSTPGKVGMLLVRTNFKPSYPTFSIHELLRIPMPAVGKLDIDQMATLTSAFDELAGVPRLSLPDAHECRVQLAIDDAVCEALDFDKELCREARHLLAREPMVTGKPYEFNPVTQAQIV